MWSHMGQNMTAEQRRAGETIVGWITEAKLLPMDAECVRLPAPVDPFSA
jgi:hypothetical protein